MMQPLKTLSSPNHPQAMHQWTAMAMIHGILHLQKMMVCQIWLTDFRVLASTLKNFEFCYSYFRLQSMQLEYTEKCAIHLCAEVQLSSQLSKRLLCWLRTMWIYTWNWGIIQVSAPEFSYILWCLGFVFHFLWLCCYWSFAELYFHIPSMNSAHPWGKTL